MPHFLLRLRAAWMRVVGLGSRRLDEFRMHEEMAFHLEQLTERHMKQGFAPQEAQRRARIAFGGKVGHEEAAREALRERVVEELLRDALLAVRMLRRSPSLTGILVATLALGIGANAAIFSALEALVLRPLPYAQPDRLVEVGLTRGNDPAKDLIVWSYPKFQLLREDQHVFSDLGLYSADPVTVRAGGAAERIHGEAVGGEYFRTLRVPPIIGRSFSPGELDHAGAPPTALIGEGLWQRGFNADPAVLGRSLDIDGKPHTIIGAMPASFTGLTGRAEVWMPIAAEFPGDLTAAWNLSYSLIARLAPGVPLARAQAAVRTIGARIDAATPRPDGPERWGAAARLLDAARVDPAVHRSLLVLSGAVLPVLLITCANVAGLLLVRGRRRESEVAIRVALGAGGRAWCGSSSPRASCSR